MSPFMPAASGGCHLTANEVEEADLHSTEEGGLEGSL